MIRFPKILLVVACLTGCHSSHYFTCEDTTVDLYLINPRADNVLFSSSINNYQNVTAVEESAGIWAIYGIDNREFRYFYIIDGTVYTPDCRFRETDDFGMVNCIYQP